MADGCYGGTRPVEQQRRLAQSKLCLIVGGALVLLALLIGMTAAPRVRAWSLERASLADLERQAASRPGDWLLHLWLGRRRLAVEQLAGAASAFRRAAQLRDQEAASWAGLGEALRRSGRGDDAVDAINRAIALEPRNAAAHASLALLAEAQGDAARALETAQQAVRLGPDEGAGWYALGGIHLRLEHPGRAIEYLQKATTLAEGEARYQQLYGEALRDMGRVEAAEPPLLRAVALAPGFPDARLSLGQLYMAAPPAEENLPRAVQELERARDLAPDTWAPRYHLGRAYLRQRRFREAAREFSRVLQLAPDYDPALLDLSRAARGLGRHEEAKRLLASFEMASANYQQIEGTRLRLAHDPDNSDLHFQLARLYLDRGRTRAAYSALQAGLKLEPHHPWGRDALHRLFHSNSTPGGRPTGRP